jgi:hypothetical protein
MVSRLKRLDAKRTFWHFMDLPPELRLEIYQRLLIDGQEKGKNHSALLRVSRLIHSESEPVLCCENTFYVEVGYPVTVFVVSDSWKPEWNISQHRTGGPSRRSLRSPIRIDMMFGLRQVAIGARALMTAGSPFDSKIAWVYREAYNSMTHVCLMLSSANNLKTLTITGLPPSSDTTWTDKALCDILTPVALIPQNVKVTVEGGSPELHDNLETFRRKIHTTPGLTLSSFGTKLSRAMHVLRAADKKLNVETC